jgi:hypothetical protein
LRLDLFLRSQQVFEHTSHLQHLFVLFEQHGKQEGFKRQRIGGVSGGCQVLPRSSKEVVQSELVASK